MYYNGLTSYIKCTITLGQQGIGGFYNMNYVQPIRDREKLEEMKEELKKNGTRDYMMFYTRN